MTELIRIARGIWRPPHIADDLAGRCVALLQACPEGAVIAGITAARLHGLWVPDRPPDERVEVILRRDEPAPRDRARCRRAELRGRRRHLSPDEIAVVDGVPVTSEARTWVDLAETLSRPDLVAVGDSVLRGRTTTAEIDEVIRRAFHRRGIVRARQTRPLLDPAARSRPESHLRVAVLDVGLPAPAVNLAIYSATGEWLGEPDLHYAEARLALEYNGAQHASVKRMRRDITRDVDIQSRGAWRLLTFGPAEVFGRPEQTASFVREVYRERVRMLHRAA